MENVGILPEPLPGNHAAGYSAMLPRSAVPILKQCLSKLVYMHTFTLKSSTGIVRLLK